MVVYPVRIGELAKKNVGLYWIYDCLLIFSLPNLHKNGGDLISEDISTVGELNGLIL